MQCNAKTQNCETYYTNQCHGYGYKQKCYQKPNYRCWDEPNNCGRMPKSICQFVPKRTCQTIPQLAKRLVPRRMCCDNPTVMMSRSAPLTQNPNCCSRLVSTEVNVTSKCMARMYDREWVIYTYIILETFHTFRTSKLRSNSRPNYFDYWNSDNRRTLFIFFDNWNHCLFGNHHFDNPGILLLLFKAKQIQESTEWLQWRIYDWRNLQHRR